MKHIKSIMPMLLMLTAISCTNMDNNNSADAQDGGKPKTYATVTEAAVAAKEDMLEAMKTVDFGINGDKLKNATPGAPVYRYELDWNALLKADSASTLENMAAHGSITIVPLINKDEVITVVSLMENDGQFGIGGLGDKQVSNELDMVRRADSLGMQSEVSIYEVPNLQALVYSVKGSNMYYTSYNNNSIRQGIIGPELVKVLKAEAMNFEKQFRDELKKGDLLK
ncbi:MAG: hypothetical protein H3C54_08245 [Taibaiella sp.]|nr:hypothetical protein [Taibaiella sp.]